MKERRMPSTHRTADCARRTSFFSASARSVWASLREDFDEAELLLVIGTSLEVHPFASLIDLGTMPPAY